MHLSNTITLTRGDSLSLTVKLEKNGKFIPFESGDTIYFTVKTSEESKEKVIQKVIKEFTSDGVAVITIYPSDTKKLLYGSYVYDIQYTDKYGNVTTIVKPSFFHIGKEVTYE